MIFSYLLHLVSVLGGHRQNIAVRFGLDELECCSYRWRKKYENMFARFDSVHKVDRRMDGDRMTVEAALCGKKMTLSSLPCGADIN